MKRRFLLLACLLTLTCTSLSAFATPPEVTVVHVEEWNGKTLIAIARPGRPEEVVEFNSARGDKNLKSTSTSYQRVIQQLYQEGYVLQSTFSTGVGTKATLVFVKNS